MMPKASVKKAILLLCLAAATVFLAGCNAKPDNSGKNNAGVGTNNDLPFPVVSTAPPVTPTIAPLMTLPSLVSPTNNPWATGSLEPGQFNTPTSGLIPQLTQLPSLGPSLTPIPAPTSSVLKLGSKGQDVKNLQTRLKALGYLKGAVDGDFGKTTEIALKAFQARNGLSPDGVAGAATLTKLSSTKALPPKASPKPTIKPLPKYTATPKINPDTYLKIGDSGAAVRKMQQRLSALGYLNRPANGVFDTLTQAAVIEFQKRNVPYWDGIAGPMTLASLYSDKAKKASGSQLPTHTLERGLENSPDVRKLQNTLKDLRFYTGEVDGDFGASTEAAVRAFQKANGLEPDGKAGSMTLQILYSGSAKSASGSNNVKPNTTSTPIIYVDVTPNPLGTYVTLREGNSGVLVRKLQQALKDGKYLNADVDGKYGVATTKAVLDFQKSKGLSQDGVAGPATQRVLFEGNYPLGS